MSDSDCSADSSEVNVQVHSSATSGGGADIDDGADSSPPSSYDASHDKHHHRVSIPRMEPVRILKQHLELPQDLCENGAIFEEFLSLETWQQLPAPIQEHLAQFLPQFTGESAAAVAAEQADTVRAMFNNEIVRFDRAPLLDFQRNLEEGNYRPDIARLRANIYKSHRREQRFQECERVSRIAKSVMISRQRLLRAAMDAPAGVTPPRARNSGGTSEMFALQQSGATLRSKRRYLKEIRAIAECVSLVEDGVVGGDSFVASEDDMVDISGGDVPRKQRRLFNRLQVSFAYFFVVRKCVNKFFFFAFVEWSY